MGYVEQNLVRGERVVYKAKLHKVIFAPAVMLGLWTLILMATAFAVDSSGALILGWLSLFLCIGALLHALIQYRTTEMAVTTRRIIGKQGLIWRKTLEMNNTMVGGVQVNQGIIDRILNRGSITFSGAGAPDNPFTGISKPLTFRRRALGSVDNRQRPQQRRRRR